jgi:hypothetical protein
MRRWDTEQEWRATLDSLAEEIKATHRPGFILSPGHRTDKAFLTTYREKLRQRYESVRAQGDREWRERYDAREGPPRKLPAGRR